MRRSTRHKSVAFMTLVGFYAGAGRVTIISQTDVAQTFRSEGLAPKYLSREIEMSNLNYARAVSAVGLAVAALAAHAESHKIELGWTNMTPCSRVEWSDDWIPSPTWRNAEQRLYAYATVEAPTAAGIQNDVQQCAVQGAAAAGLTSILASPAGAMPAFSAQFESCMRERAADYFGLSLDVDSQCMW